MPEVKPTEVESTAKTGAEVDIFTPDHIIEKAEDLWTLLG